MSILPSLHAVVAGQTLSEDEADQTMAVILEGSKVKDPLTFAQRINELLVKDAGL